MFVIINMIETAVRAVLEVVAVAIGRHGIDLGIRSFHIEIAPTVTRASRAKTKTWSSKEPTCGTLKRVAKSEDAADLPKSEIDMLQKYAVIIVATLALAGCAVPPNEDNDPFRIGNIPESVAALAAPDQDLNTARLRPEDDCYWYEHNGPVENTLVPLRSADGNPICVARQS
ncbi:MAG: hypothetical protein RIF44_04705 [Nitratireductor sp.]